MRRACICGLLFATVAGFTSFLTANGTLHRFWRSTIKGEPIIEYPETIELGEHNLGDEAVGHFTIANRGGAELIIDQIQTNCSCTGMEREEDGKYVRLKSLRLRPGEKADLLMRVSVRGRFVGMSMVNTVWFATNDPGTPEGQIKAVVRWVRGGITTDPESVAFGVIPEGSHNRQRVRVYDSAATPRHIRRVISSNPERVSARVQSPDPAATPAPSGDRHIADLEIFVNGKRAGPVEEKVYVYLSDNQSKPDEVLVVGKVVPPVELFPSVLILPRSSPKGPVYDAICLCRTRSGKPVKVTFDAVPDGLSAEVRDRTQPDDGSALIHVRCDPNKLKQLIRKGRQPIRLRASDGGGQVALTLSVSVAPGR